MEALGILGLVLLACHASAHVAVVASFAREAPGRAAFAFVFPPAGVLWAWDAGRKKRVVVYGATLAAFVVVLVVAAFVR